MPPSPSPTTPSLQSFHLLSTALLRLCCPWQEEKEALKEALFTDYQSGKVELHMKREKVAERVNNYNAAVLRIIPFPILYSQTN